jgi:nucleoside-diphosphate-sugar epimerase
MKIFITGTTGFLGRSLKEHFAQHHEIAEYRRGSDVFMALEAEKPDVIVNCAGEIYDASKMYSTNVALVEAILEWIKRNPKTRLIQIGSSAEYGPVNRATNEQDRINPVDVYQATKGAATLLCQGYARQFGLQTLVARIYSGYGAYERPHRLFPRLYRAFFHNEPMTLYDGVHDFIYINDFVRGIDLVLQREWPVGEIVNFGSGTQYQNLDVLTAWKQTTGIVDPPIKYQEQFSKAFESPVWCCNVNHALLTYNFKTEFTLEQGIADFIRKKHVNQKN